MFTLLAVGCDPLTSVEDTQLPPRRAAKLEKEEHEQEEADASAEVVLAGIRNFVKSNGFEAQKLVVTLRNTGDVPVRTVDANITTRDSGGSIIQTWNYTIYAVSKAESEILPNKLWRTPKSKGHVFPHMEQADSVDVTVSYASSKQG
ncbi:hypothetical protein [Adhaeretor mobilis]|uniref:Uncharacterized protein n=1 Tax=Adhaeretor mobilis TaxID=1930276 RepID=A0A517N2M1_9BACT|nr:hypothetical protein [Adhaeretor mobilis]QDT01389.1 hypothetical protein HG15A2_47310 [Adhaeretor mobilis]